MMDRVLEADHAAIAEVFDGLDSLLEFGSFAGPHRFIDASVDPEAIQESLTGGVGVFDRYVDA